MIPPLACRGNARALCLTILPILSAAFLATGAAAQTVNYGALEQLFGESVTTSATGQPQRETEVPAAMEIVSAAQIRRSGAVDIPGALKQVPGIDVMQWAADNSDLSVRGYDQAFSSRLLVLVDGRQVYADQYGYTPWAALPVELSTIRQIEVVKGPNTALFGANAVSGVINIITYNPLYDEVNTASVTGGTQGTVGGSAVTTLQDKGRWAVRLSGSGGFDDDFTTPVPAYNGSINRRQNWREAVDLNGIVQLNARTQFSLDFSHSQTQTNSIDPSYSLAQGKHLTSSAKGQLDADTDFGLIQAVAYTNWIAQDSTSGLADFDFDDQSTVIQLQDVLRLGDNHVVRAAFEFRHNEVNTTPVTGGRISYDTPSFSGMWNWTISPSLSWTNAVRFDSLTLGRAGTAPAGYPFANSAWNGNNLSQWGFNSGLVWKTTSDDTVRLLVSRGIALPSLAHLGSFVLTTPFFNATGNPDLRASAVMNYELDWDRQIDAIGAFLRTALFYQRTTSVISLSGGFVPGPPVYTTTANIGSSDAIGGELSLRGEFLANWHWGASYRFETIKDKFAPGAQNGTAFTDFQHVTPHHQVKANLGWTRGVWEADASVYYQSATQGLFPTLTGTGLTPVQAYFNADGRIGYRINDNLTLSVSGQNLLQSQQVQTSGPAIERRVFVNLAAAY